jgi:hypothetical protein
VRTLWVAALVGLAAVMSDGCKSNKPEPIPGPKATSAAIEPIGAKGIAWFQGTMEEPFSRAYAGESEGRPRGVTARHSGERCPASVSHEAPARSWLRSITFSLRNPSA